MLEIKKTYVTDSKKRPLAVQVDIKTFEKIAKYVNYDQAEISMQSGKND